MVRQLLRGGTRYVVGLHCECVSVDLESTC